MCSHTMPWFMKLHRQKFPLLAVLIWEFFSLLVKIELKQMIKCMCCVCVFQSFWNHIYQKTACAFWIHYSIELTNVLHIFNSVRTLIPYKRKERKTQMKIHISKLKANSTSTGNVKWKTILFDESLDCVLHWLRHAFARSYRSNNNSPPHQHRSVQLPAIRYLFA